MKRSRTFSPRLSEVLEARDVPTVALAGAHVLVIAKPMVVHASVAPVVTPARAATVAPKVAVATITPGPVQTPPYSPGTFPMPFYQAEGHARPLF